MNTNGDEASKGAGAFDNVQGWIESGHCPVPKGPSPWVVSVLALVAVNLAFAVFPTSNVFLGISITLFIIAAGAAAQFHARGGAKYGAAVIVPALIALGWSIGLYLGETELGLILPHTILSAGALILGFVRRIDGFQHAWSEITGRCRYWNDDDVTSYAEFLLERRPCPGSAHLARELYRRASERAIDRPWSARRGINAMKRYAELLRTGVGGETNTEEADWWYETASLAREEAARRTMEYTFGSAISDPPALLYGDHLPVWCIQISDSDRFTKCKVTVTFRSFLLPQAGVIACAIRFFADPQQPTVVHRLFDVSDPDVEAYLSALEHHLAWRVELSRDESDPIPLRAMKIPLADTGFMAALNAVIAHNYRLGENLDSEKAIEFVTSKMDDFADLEGIEAAWAAIDEACDDIEK